MANVLFSFWKTFLKKSGFLSKISRSCRKKIRKIQVKNFLFFAPEFFAKNKINVFAGNHSPQSLSKALKNVIMHRQIWAIFTHQKWSRTSIIFRSTQLCKHPIKLSSNYNLYIKESYIRLEWLYSNFKFDSTDIIQFSIFNLRKGEKLFEFVHLFLMS